jgi:sn-glycerol 3-phosphate transport system ATP-binding protein
VALSGSSLAYENKPVSEVVLTNVYKKWGDSVAVSDVSFTAEQGKLLVLLGPSGCGKSTTLRLIAGLEEVSAGYITIGGQDATVLPPAKRNLSMVFQSYALFPHLSVAENIVFGLKVRRVEPNERRRRLERVAEMLGLAELLHRKPAQLSGGQRQRVALGRALIAEALLCLMDEPLSNLDAKLRQEMRSEIRSLQQRLGITMIYVTHDQTEAMTMADRIILLREGRIEQNGTPEELYGRPATAFTARFIGTPPMNLLQLASNGKNAVVDGTLGPAVLEQRGEGLLLGVRPEHIVLSQKEGIPAQISDIEYHGAESIVTCAVGTQSLALRVAGHAHLTRGAQVRLQWAAANVHLFEVESENRRDSAAGRRDVAGKVASR